MSYWNTTGEQDDPAGPPPPPPEFGAPPPYPGQAGPAGPPGWPPGPQVPPGYGPPTYGPPTYYPPGYGPPMYAPPGPPPATYTGWAVSTIIGGVLFSLLVGLPTALVGRSYGAKVNRLYASGDLAGAYRASRKARGWLTASTVFDLLGLVLLVFLFIIPASSSPVSFSTKSVVPASVPVVPAQQPVQAGMTGMMDGCHGHGR